VQRFSQRQGFLVSAVIHLTLLMILIAHPPSRRRPTEIEPWTLEKRDLVFLPPAAVLRQLAPKLPAAPRAQPVPAPTPAPERPTEPNKKDRISIGPPTGLRSKGPLILRREDDLTKVPKGQPSPPPRVAPTPAPALAQQRGGGTPETPGREGLRLPPGLAGLVARGDEGSRRRPGSIGASIPGAIDGVARRMERDAQLGLPTGTGQNLGGLYFDPRGADFTVWINHFKNEVYRNWIVPQAALLGFRGHVDFEFTVERDGSMSALRLLKSSGTPSLDRAAHNALTGSRFAPLPDDYGPPRVTMQVAFYYNEAPQGS
jgi:TonB family protein